MPTYEYRCSNGHHFDKRQKISERPITKCPECGAHATRQISGGVGLVFKGTGFYITDYGKDGKGPAKRPVEPSRADTSIASSGADKPPAKPPAGKAGAASSRTPGRKAGE